MGRAAAAGTPLGAVPTEKKEDEEAGSTAPAAAPITVPLEEPAEAFVGETVGVVKIVGVAEGVLVTDIVGVADEGELICALPPVPSAPSPL